MKRMTNQQIADRALEADRQRRAAMARGDYQEAREYRDSRNEWIVLLDDGYSDKRLVKIFRARVRVRANV